MRPTRLLKVAAAVALVSAAAACSSGSGKSSSSSSSSSKSSSSITYTTLDPNPVTMTTVDGSTVDDTCGFFRTEEVRRLFDDAPGKVTSKSGAIINGKSCTLGLHTPQLEYALVVSVQEGAATYGEKFVLNAKHLDGLGETAYVAKRSIGGALIISFVRAGRTYTFTYAKSGDVKTKPDPSDQSDELLAIIRSAVARLP